MKKRNFRETQSPAQVEIWEPKAVDMFGIEINSGFQPAGERKIGKRIG
ncbi:hypothetical protein TDIS_1500 [Thermosulfurimonas dismutans]|uniref:Uncharacterized protein n=1 Tax=Thermosulfurimonas dismutans TaxID=999894 RepID=A0A179D338_9BACT|nr:hypothetical protein TDIS_1500 [Thermosulfurimonas dismutans]